MKSTATAMLLAEANQWPEDAVAYFGEAAATNATWPFTSRSCRGCSWPSAWRTATPSSTFWSRRPPSPTTRQWALFLRNHDELTLEMVTDEERDYMYRVYAQDHQARINLGIRRRLAPLLEQRPRQHRADERAAVFAARHAGALLRRRNRHGRQHLPRRPQRRAHADAVELATATPVSRAPIRRASTCPIIIDPEYHYEAVNVEAQQNNVHSLLWWMKRLLALRKRHQAFGRGSLEILDSDNPRMLAFVRSGGDEHLLVVANLSRFAQCTRINLSQYQGRAPVELLGQTPFPAVGGEPYFLTLGPYAFYWFSLVHQDEAARSAAAARVLTVSGSDGWHGIFHGKARLRLEEALPAFLQTRPWFQGQGRTVKAVTVREVVPVDLEKTAAQIALVQVEYTDSEPQLYALPLAFAVGPHADGESRAIARLRLAPRRRRPRIAGSAVRPMRRPCFRGGAGRIRRPRRPHSG